MLEIDNVKVALDSEAGLVKAIDGMRLTLHRGETFALVGESGCGKSMTALALMRLLPENGVVAAGDIHIGAGATRWTCWACPSRRCAACAAAASA